MERVHIINQMQNSNGGSEQRALQMQKILSEITETLVWSEFSLPSDFCSQHNIKKIVPQRLHFPKSGIFIFVGTYYWVGQWLRWTNPSRIIVIHNLPQLDYLRQFLDRILSLKRSVPLHLAYAAEWMKKQADIPGEVLLSPIDIGKFSPSLRKKTNQPIFTVGRLSRNDKYKHHPDDASLYDKLVQQGMKVRVMGGLHLLDECVFAEKMDLIESGIEPAEEFLATLDAFFYRTSPDWYEPHARVVTESMAMGIPTIVGRDGGHTEFIDHGINGFIVSDNETANDVLLNLKNNPELRRKIGNTAATSMQRRMREGIQKNLNFILSDTLDRYDVRKYF